MRNIFKFTMLAALISVTATSCLKDEGFEDQEYGIQITEVKGVAFPQAARSPVMNGIVSQTAPLVLKGLGPYITLEQSAPATEDVTVTLALNPALVTEVTSPVMEPLPTANFQVAPLTVVIPKGKTKSDTVAITILNGASLNPLKTYGIGFTIASVDKGYKIAANQKNLVLGFNIKNKYDGVYNLRGFHNRPGLDRPYNETVHMITNGPSSVYMFWPAANVIAHPLNGGSTYYGAFTTNFIFNSADQLIGWDFSPYATTLPTGMGPATDSRFDPATKTIYAQFHYNNNPAARGFTDTLRYIGPRP